MATKTVVHIHTYIDELLDSGATSSEVAEDLGISMSMISHYKKRYNASIEVAKRVYANDGVVLHPFSEESLKYELDKERR